MKKSIAFILILFICVNYAYQLQKNDQITSLDPVTVKSPGNFNNVAPEVTEIITPQYTGPKLSVTHLTTKEKKDCNGTTKKHVDRHYIYYDVDKKQIIKPDDTKEKFGVSSEEKKPDVKPDDVKPDDVKPDDVKPDDVKPADPVNPDDAKPADVVIPADRAVDSNKNAVSEVKPKQLK